MWAQWILLVSLAVLTSSSEQIAGRTFQVSFTNNTFLKDGKPFQYISGSIHYFRVPNEYWQDRLKKIRLLGFNTICTYIEWSLHEPKEGVYNFAGDADVVKFIQLAQEEGLNVILRPGPYICAEREFGGFPAWLLTENPKMRFRTSDPSYLYYVEKWLSVLYERITPLLYGNGGPIITVQLENEYGFYPENDKNYLIWLRDLTLTHVGEKAVLFTTDTAWNEDTIRRGQIPGVFTTVDFGTTNAAMSSVFSHLKNLQNNGPLVDSEFYPGWISYWGKPLSKVSTDSVVSTITAMLQNKVNFNVYMIFGGTNFGFSAGSDYCLTSYDYDAPISEAGDLTEKYMAIRELLEKNGWPVGTLEEVEKIRESPKGAYGQVYLKPVVSLINSPLGKNTVQSQYPLTMEAYGQSYGLIAYNYILTSDSLDPSFLSMHAIDRSTVMVDGDVIAQLQYGRIDTTPIPPTAKKGSTLTVLVENVGRRTFGGLYDVTRGIIGNVTIDGKIAENWKVTSYPLEMEDIKALEVYAAEQSQDDAKIPAFFTSSFGVPPPTTGAIPPPLDTFLDMTGWGKGYVWINGHNLGRYWHIGPQMTLYVPGVWLNPYPQPNSITILELQYTSQKREVEFINNPIFTY